MRYILLIVASIVSLGYYVYTHSYTPPTNDPGYVLITSLYNERNQDRVREYLICLQQNLNHTLIKKVVIFYDTGKDVLNHEENRLLEAIKKLPVTIEYLQDRPDFELCFNFANTHFPHERIIIANADIFFNDTLAKLSSFDLANTFIALTRWNLQKNGVIQFYGSNFSQDVWIFTTPLRPFKKSSYKLGTPACDIYIAYQAKAAGLNVINPALSVQAIHLHNTNVRNYTPTDPAEPFIGLAHTKLPGDTNGF